MEAKRKRYQFTAWKNLNIRGKQMRLLMASLPILCAALIAVSIYYFHRRETEQAEVAAAYTEYFLKQAQVTPDVPPIPQSTARPAVLQDVDGHPVIAILFIEKLELELLVLGETTDAMLEIAPCLFLGPSSPAYDGNMVIWSYQRTMTARTCTSAG